MSKYIMAALTTSQKNYELEGAVRIYGVGVSELGGEYRYYNNVVEFIDFLMSTVTKSATVYVEDLDFLGPFITHELSTILEYNPNDRDIEKNQFSAMTSGSDFYKMRIKIKDKTRTTPNLFINFKDIKKMIPLEYSKLAESFGHSQTAVAADHCVSSQGHINTHEYCLLADRAATLTVAVSKMVAMGLDSTTLSGSAFKELKRTIPRFERIYPSLSKHEHKFAYRSFKSGYNSLNENYAGIENGVTTALDVNSMFSYVMKEEELPYGEGIWFDGEYEYDEMYPLYIIRFVVSDFNIKRNGIAMVKGDRGPKMTSDKYIEETYESMVLTMTNIELELFKDNYDTGSIRYMGGYKYKTSKGNFDEFIDKWSSIKEQATVNGDIAMRTVSKFMLNYSFGKMGQKDTIFSTKMVLSDVIEYKVDIEANTTNYMPVATFITSYAVKKMVNAIKKLGDRFIYCDVDSLHFIGSDIPDELKSEIDQTKLGYWKIEGVYDKSKFLKLKTYIEVNDKETVIKAAGAGDAVRKNFKFENFVKGGVFDGSYTNKLVPGGLLRVPQSFTL